MAAAAARSGCEALPAGMAALPAAAPGPAMAPASPAPRRRAGPGPPAASAHAPRLSPALRGFEGFLNLFYFFLDASRRLSEREGARVTAQLLLPFLQRCRAFASRLAVRAGERQKGLWTVGAGSEPPLSLFCGGNKGIPRFVQALFVSLPPPPSSHIVCCCVFFWYTSPV